MVENHKNYTVIFDFLPKMADFLTFDRLSKMYQNIRLLIIDFPKIIPKFETVTGRHGLNFKTWYDILTHGI